MNNFKCVEIMDLNHRYNDDKKHLRHVYVKIDFEINKILDPSGHFTTTFFAHPIIPNKDNIRDINLIINKNNDGIIMHANVLKTNTDNIAKMMSEKINKSHVKTVFNIYVHEHYILGENGKLILKPDTGEIYV